MINTGELTCIKNQIKLCGQEKMNITKEDDLKKE